MDNMKISEQLKDFIKDYEKLELKSYQDEALVWTIGYGHTGKDIAKGMTITQNQADIFLSNDLSKFENAVNKYVKVPLSQNQFDSLVAFSYNIGIGGFKNSTLLKLLNGSDYEGASLEFQNWNKITENGEKKVSDGLSVRRYDEENIFKDNIYNRTDIETYRQELSKENNNESSTDTGNNDQANNDAEYMKDQDGKDIPDIKDGTLVADSGQIKTDVNYDQDSQTLFYADENGNIQQISYEDNSDLLIYGDTSNPDKITFTDENGDYQVWEKDSEGNFVQTNKVDYSRTLNTAINQIGSLIIMNNQDFSNVEKIVVSTKERILDTIRNKSTNNKIINKVS